MSVEYILLNILPQGTVKLVTVIPVHSKLGVFMLVNVALPALIVDTLIKGELRLNYNLEII
jgi:hypothetical protein